ncbi:MAG: DUF91 domain-containing protein [Rhodovulum sp.]|nr:DUF91 domain-containing protein [Rhodovulum sp.]
MPIQHSLWHVADEPLALPTTVLPAERDLEAMIVATPEILSPDWMIIGRQCDTGASGRIDLLALAPDGTLILIELKRDKTPREVVAQALDYATWVAALKTEDIAQIFARFQPGGSLDEAFKARFGQALDPETLNQSHQIVIVAASLDAASERIVAYLNQRDIAINVLCFQVFDTGAGLLLSRAWLLDPVETQVAAVTTSRGTVSEPWNGEYYACFGQNSDRDWDEARRYGFISAGGGAWYSGTLRLLKPGDLVWVKVPGRGFVGVGRVRGAAVPAAEFELIGADGTEQPALSVLTKGSYLRDSLDDPERREVFVPIDWAETRPLSEAVNETGMFGNQNTVCAPKTPKWRHTVERLKELFPNWAKGA